jgi:putative peptidoglycan lipid II flippase
MACTLASRLLGIIKARALTAAFGAGAVADVINVAYFFPNSLRKLFAEGAADAAFIPGFSTMDSKKDRSRLLSLIVSFQAGLFLLLVGITYLFRYDIFGFISDFKGESLRLGGNLLPAFMLFLAFLSIATVFWGLLKCDRKFLLASLSPLFCSIAIILCLTFLSDTLGAFSMALGTVIGSLLQMAYCIILTVRFGYSFHLSLAFRDPDFLKVLKAWLIIILSSAITILSQQYSQYLASSLAEGSATAYANGIIFFSVPYGIIFNGIVAVAFTELSDAHSHGQADRFSFHLSYAINGLVACLVPSALVLGFLSKEVIACILQTGRFTYADTQLTSGVLIQLMAGIVIVALKACMYRTMLAKREVNKTLSLTIIEALLDIFLSWLLVGKYHSVEVLPIAGNLSAFVMLMIYIGLLKNDMQGKRILASGLKVILANLPLLFVLLLYAHQDFTWFQSGSTGRNLLYLCLCMLLLGILVLFSYHIAGIPVIDFLKAGGRRHQEK